MVQELNSVNISLDFLSVCEAAAIASARTMGQGDRKYSDHVAVEAMREKMDAVPMRGRIVIGEGERDEAPMLFIGEEWRGFHKARTPTITRVDIAVDPLEHEHLPMGRTTLSRAAASERGMLKRARHLHDKIVAGLRARANDIEAGQRQPQGIARA